MTAPTKRPKTKKAEKARETDSGQFKGQFSIDGALDAWSVLPPGDWENETGPTEWFAVAGPDGIVAYFGKEDDACRYRLAEVNRMLNP
jgi:hypothetical protein